MNRDLKLMMQPGTAPRKPGQATQTPGLPLRAAAPPRSRLSRRPSRPLRRRRWLAGVALVLGALAGPLSAGAHGDLYLRIVALTKQIEAATNNPARLYLERGELYRQHAEWEPAAADYERAAQLDPGLAQVEVCRAKLLADSGKLDAALTLFDKAIARSPEAGEAFVGRARVLVKLNRRPAALADYQRGLDLLAAPAPEDYLAWAQQLVTDGQVEPALRALEQGIKKLGPLLALQSYALDLELSRKTHEGALTRLDSIIAHASRQEGWLAKRGDVLLAANQPAEARKAYEAALAAIHKLPPLLRDGPAMQKLRAQVDAALAKISSSPTEPKAN